MRMKKIKTNLCPSYSGHGSALFLLWFVFTVFLQGVAGCLTWPTFPSMKRVGYWNGPYNVLVSDSGEIAIPILVMGKGMLVPDSPSTLMEDTSNRGTPAYLHADSHAFQEYIRKRHPSVFDGTETYDVDINIDDLGQGVWFLTSAEEARRENRWFSVELDKTVNVPGVKKYGNPDLSQSFQRICFPYKFGDRMIEISLSTENSRPLGFSW